MSRQDLSQQRSIPLTGLFGCIRCGQGFKRYEDLEKHLQTIHKDAKAEDDALDLQQLRGEFNIYLDEQVNQPPREPALVPSDHQVFMNLEKNPLPQHLFKR
jgi:uncharacterized C2H2 Zn-finger protein